MSPSPGWTGSRSAPGGCHSQRAGSWSQEAARSLGGQASTVCEVHPPFSTLNLSPATAVPRHNVQRAYMRGGLRCPCDFYRHSIRPDTVPGSVGIMSSVPLNSPPAASALPSNSLLCVRPRRQSPELRPPDFISFSRNLQKPAQQPILPKIARESPGTHQCLFAETSPHCHERAI